MIWKANCIMCTFQGVDSVAMTHLYRSFCLSLYGSALWNLSYKAFRIVEVAFNNILRRICRLPAHTHTAILHSVAGLQSMYNVAAQRYNCPSHLVQSVSRHSITSCYTFSGFNFMYGSRYLKSYADQDLICANFIRNVRITGSYHL